MRKRVFRFIGIAITTSFLTGCTNVATFDYATAPGPMAKFQEKGVAKKSIAVLPFMDQRGTKYFDPMQAGQAAAHPTGDRRIKRSFTAPAMSTSSVTASTSATRRTGKAQPPFSGMESGRTRSGILPSSSPLRTREATISAPRLPHRSSAR